MTETRYGKYIIDRPVKKREPPEMTEEEIKARQEFFTVPLYVDSEVIPGSYYFNV